MTGRADIYGVGAMSYGINGNVGCTGWGQELKTFWIIRLMHSRRI